VVSIGTGSIKVGTFLVFFYRIGKKGYDDLLRG